MSRRTSAPARAGAQGSTLSHTSGKPNPLSDRGVLCRDPAEPRIGRDQPQRGQIRAIGRPAWSLAAHTRADRPTTATPPAQQ